MKCATGRWIRDWDPIKNFGLLSLIFPIYKAQIGCPQSVISTGESLNFDPRPPLCLCYNIGLRCMIQSTHCTSQVKHRPFSVPMQGFDLAVLEDNQSDPNQGSAAWSKRRHVTTLRSRDMRLRSRDSWGQSGNMTKGTSYSQWISQQQAIIQSREAVGLQGINNGQILPLSMYVLLLFSLTISNLFNVGLLICPNLLLFSATLCRVWLQGAVFNKLSLLFAIYLPHIPSPRSTRWYIFPLTFCGELCTNDSAVDSKYCAVIGSRFPRVTHISFVNFNLLVQRLLFIFLEYLRG